MTFKTEFFFGEYRVNTISTGNSHRENCYIVTHLPSAERVLIDPGDSAESILEALGADGARPGHILLTHGHHDHVGAVAALCRRFGMSCEVHKKDERLMKQAPMYSMAFARKKIEPPQPYETFEGQPDFRLGGCRIAVLHTPGHTTGSVCYSFDGFTFTGDTLFYQTIGRVDLPGGSADELAESVSRLVEELPGEAAIFPGHGRPWTISEARAWWRQEKANSR